MKNLKFLIVLVFVFFAGLNSCSEDDNLMIADSIENNNSDNLYSKNYKNNIYEVNAKGEVSKVMSNGKSYRIFLSKDNSQISTIIHDNFMQIRNTWILRILNEMISLFLLMFKLVMVYP